MPSLQEHCSAEAQFKKCPKNLRIVSAVNVDVMPLQSCTSQWTNGVLCSRQTSSVQSTASFSVYVKILSVQKFLRGTNLQPQLNENKTKMALQGAGFNIRKYGYAYTNALALSRLELNVGSKLNITRAFEICVHC